MSDEDNWELKAVFSPISSSKEEEFREFMFEQNMLKRKYQFPAEDEHDMIEHNDEYVWTANKHEKLSFDGISSSSSSSGSDSSSCFDYLDFFSPCNVSTSCEPEHHGQEMTTIVGTSSSDCNTEQEIPGGNFTKFVLLRGHIFVKNCHVGSKIKYSIYQTPSNGAIIRPSMNPQFTHLADFETTITKIKPNRKEQIIKLGKELAKFKSTIKPDRTKFTFIQFDGTTKEKLFLYCEPKDGNMHNVALFDNGNFVKTERRNLKGIRGRCEVETVKSGVSPPPMRM